MRKTMDANQREIAQRVALKFIRESDKVDALLVLWKYILKEASNAVYSDGFVEWWLLEGRVDDLFDKLKNELEKWGLPEMADTDIDFTDTAEGETDA
jgi:hypothetical protein